jgi:hypothetical protein
MTPTCDHERFISGQGESGRQYIIHTHPPRFVAELFADDESDWIAAGGLSLSIPETGEVLANFAWIDDPSDHDAEIIRQRVADHLLELDARAEMEIEAQQRRDEDEDE